MAICASCQERITIYDLAFYPAAVKLEGEETFVAMDSMPVRPSQVYVCYEYGELDPDQQFDRDDICWCQIFTESQSGQLVRVFDDETA